MSVSPLSPLEEIKVTSRFLRGTIAQELENPVTGAIPESDLGPEYIIPSVFNRAVAPAVADAVANAAVESGIARRERSTRQAEVPAP